MQALVRSRAAQESIDLLEPEKSGTGDAAIPSLAAAPSNPMSAGAHSVVLNRIKQPEGPAVRTMIDHDLVLRLAGEGTGLRLSLWDFAGQEVCAVRYWYLFRCSLDSYSKA